LDRMATLETRVRQNEIPVSRLAASELRELEPNVRGLGALLVASTGIVSYPEIARALAEEASIGGTEIRLGAQVRGIRDSGADVGVETAGETIRARRLVACAGLQADRVALASGIRVEERIVPFRGEYYELPDGRRNLVRHLIYPIPDPGLPFLGIHLTPMIDGRLTVGPNAVLGLAREGYRRGSLDLADLGAMASFPGFWRTVRTNLRSGVREMRNSILRSGYLGEARRYCPGLEPSDLRPYPAGIRAQAVRRDGSLVDDFLFAQTDRMLHVVNAPSPAATSALPIGELIAERLLRPSGAGPP
ncbi:MAG TPA: L-2-hydroxyglutarate oxidase, partial [Candidatus Binatus sp.]|nr:L-2-hydroxyglutarate oxidase [Candidatus Binatus sp.]